jgi:hypothetical protein
MEEEMTKSEEKNDRYASEGFVWQCQACGKISPFDQYGDEFSSRGWDVSCVLNSKLIPTDKKKEDFKKTGWYPCD